ncbi:transposase [Bryobacterales bacterium F-183]|nr:transposase [Bryobacterales bacterium F-183]
MPRNARVIAPGLPYHITQRGTNRQRVFFTDADRSLYLRLIRENLEEAKAKVLAYCLMTNHVHFVVIPEQEDSLALLFGRANGRYAQAINIRKGRSGHLWQARYNSCPMSERHFWVGLRYVETNPCRAGIVQLPEEYKWSSARNHLTGDPDRSRVLDTAFWERAGGIDAWRDLHNRPLDMDMVTNLRKCTYAGRPFGDSEFLEAMEVRFQRKWRVERTQYQIPESSEKAAAGCP